MRKLTSIILVVLSLLMALSAFGMSASAAPAYQTYTYAIDGTPRYSPDAYSATYSIDSAQMGLEVELKNPSDLITDKNEKVYIADTGNNRIVVLDRWYKFEREISTFVNSQGNNDELAGPEGVFVTDDAIWVCDTKKSRIVKFDLEGNFQRIVDEPESQLFAKNHVYTPVAMAIDQYGRMYIVSSSTYQGVIVMDPDGNFVGFVGSQAASISAWELLMRRFRTEEQQDAQDSTLTTEFNNVAITPDGFIYVTTSSIKESEVSSAISGKSKEGKFMPVKLLNPAGDEIMRRNGFWPPAGEVALNSAFGASVTGPSTVIDVAVGPEKTWSIIDSKRNKIYTYDFNGNLLFAFGDKGSLLGSIGDIKAICYQNDTMLILDKKSPTSTIIVYERTGYGDLLLQAIAAENSLDYNYAIECWEAVLQRNSNFDAAYVGIGNAFYRSGEYEKSLEYYEKAYDTENWSNSYKEVRKEWMSSYFIPLVIALIAILVAIVKFFGFAAKYNKRVAVNGRARKTFVQELMYGFYVIFHPFDGFYDLKHERRGSLRASIVFLALTVLAFFYQGIGQGYVMNPTHQYSTIFEQLIAVMVPFLLFVIANWCLTTLFEGEGSFKDIFIATSYSLLPMPLLIIPATLCSNWVTVTEASIVEMVVTLAFIWAFLLIFFGTMVTHDYSMGKNVITTVGTIVAMAFIIFIVLLFSLLLTKLVSLVTNIVTEIEFRL